MDVYRFFGALEVSVFRQMYVVVVPCLSTLIVPIIIMMWCLGILVRLHRAVIRCSKDKNANTVSQIPPPLITRKRMEVLLAIRVI